MTQQTSRRVALVTGGSRGIGAAIALRLAATATPWPSTTRPAPLPPRRWPSRSVRPAARPLRADVSDPGQANALFEAAEAALGRIDVLVNSAGVLQPLAQTSDEQYEQMFNINTRGTFNMLRAAATRLADEGRVINLSSTTIALNLPGYAAYIGNKAAVEGFTRVFAKELRGRRVTVNAVAPAGGHGTLHDGQEPRTDRALRRCRRWSWASPTTSPAWWRSWPDRTAAGSTARCCAPTAAWPDAARRADGSPPSASPFRDGAPGRMPRPAPAWRNPARAGSRAPAVSISRAHA